MVTSASSSLPPSELLQPLTFQHFAHVHVADAIDPDSVWSPELAWRVAALAAETTDQVAVQIADADVVFELRDVDDPFAVNVHVGRALHLRPHVEELTIGREDLDAVVLAVEQEDAVGVHPDAVRRMELARFFARVAQLLRVAWLAPRFEQRALRTELVHSGVTVAVRDKDVAVGRSRHVRWLVERRSAVRNAVGHRQARAG